MSSFVRFTLAQCADWFVHTFSLIKTKCQGTYRQILKSQQKRLKLFVYVNLFLSSVTLLYLSFSSKHNKGILKRTYCSIAFLLILGLEWILTLVLIYAYKEKHGTLCQIWCLGEIMTIILLLLFALNKWVLIAWPGLVMLSIFGAVKLHGLWVIYYHSLELKSDSLSDYFSDSSNSKKWNPHRRNEDGLSISYFASNGSRNGMKRRDTDVTSVGSSAPQSPISVNEENNDSDEVREEASGTRRKISTTSTPSQFKFFADAEPIKRGDLLQMFGEQPSYAEIMGHTTSTRTVKEQSEQFTSERTLMQSEELIPIPYMTIKSKESIIISDLMCGGTSAINIQSS